jgi:hypothetical protein
MRHKSYCLFWIEAGKKHDLQLQKSSERIMETSENSCAEKIKEFLSFQMGRGTVQNTNEKYHVAKSYFLIRHGRIPVIF